MAPQHGREIGTQLGQPLLCTLFILNDNIVAVLLKGGLPVSWIFDGAELGVFDNGSDSLLPSPVWLNVTATEELDECCFCFLGRVILGILVCGDKGLGLEVVAEGQLARFTNGLTMIAVMVVVAVTVAVAVMITTSKSTMTATTRASVRSGRSSGAGRVSNGMIAERG
jgi:hypothetical protein